MTEPFNIDKPGLKENPFSVPEGYFSQLQSQILESLPEQPEKVVEMKPKRRNARPFIMVAASVCVLVGCFFAYYFIDSQTRLPQPVATTNQEFDEMLTDIENAESYILADNSMIYSYINQ